VVSVSIYRQLDLSGLDKVETYDLVDRSYEFEVFGNLPLMNQIFQHEGEWSFAERAAALMSAVGPAETSPAAHISPSRQSAA
jgi:hypothetical protein